MVTKKRVKAEVTTDTEKVHVNNTGSICRIDNSVSGVLKRLNWPSLATAIKYAINCMIATAVIGILLTMYEFGINAILSLFY